MKRKSEVVAFADALSKLERSLETPVIPGEWSTWIASVRRSCDVVGRLLQHENRRSHEDRLREIGEQDPELLSRVQQLRKEDEEVANDFEALEREIATLDRGNSDRLANQSDADERIAKLIERGLAFVIRARTQETTLSTWYMEAFQRDRGIAD